MICSILNYKHYIYVSKTSVIGKIQNFNHRHWEIHSAGGQLRQRDRLQKRGEKSCMRRHTNIQKPELERKKKTQLVQLLKCRECFRLKGQSRNWGVLHRRCMKIQRVISWMWFRKLAREEQGHKWWSMRTSLQQKDEKEKNRWNI